MNSTTTNTKTRILFNGEEYTKATDCIYMVNYGATTTPTRRIVCRHIEVRRK